MKEKTVILVTHQLQFLQFVDQIVVLTNGNVSFFGSYDSLREKGFDFSQLLVNPANDYIDDEIYPLKRVESHNKLRLSQRSTSDSVTSSDEVFEEESQMRLKEKRAEGSVGLKLYGKYFKANGNYFMLYVMGLFCVATQLLASGCDYYVNFW